MDQFGTFWFEKKLFTRQRWWCCRLVARWPVEQSVPRFRWSRPFCTKDGQTRCVPNEAHCCPVKKPRYSDCFRHLLIRYQSIKTRQNETHFWKLKEYSTWQAMLLWSDRHRRLKCNRSYRGCLFATAKYSIRVGQSHLPMNQRILY